MHRPFKKVNRIQHGSMFFFHRFSGQFNLANVNCITRLHELLQTHTDPMTRSKVLLALNNLALNEFAINQFRVNLNEK